MERELEGGGCCRCLRAVLLQPRLEALLRRLLLGSERLKGSFHLERRRVVPDLLGVGGQCLRWIVSTSALISLEELRTSSSRASWLTLFAPRKAPVMNMRAASSVPQ